MERRAVIGSGLGRHVLGGGVERRVQFGFTDTPAVRLCQRCFRARWRCSGEVFPDWRQIGPAVAGSVRQIRAKAVGVAELVCAAESANDFANFFTHLDLKYFLMNSR